MSVIRVCATFIRFYCVPGTGAKYLIYVLIKLLWQPNGILIEAVVNNSDDSNYCVCFMWIVLFESHNNPMSNIFSFPFSR